MRTTYLAPHGKGEETALWAIAISAYSKSIVYINVCPFARKVLTSKAWMSADSHGGIVLYRGGSGGLTWAVRTVYGPNYIYPQDQEAK